MEKFKAEREEKLALKKKQGKSSQRQFEKLQKRPGVKVLLSPNSNLNSPRLSIESSSSEDDKNSKYNEWRREQEEKEEKQKEEHAQAVAERKKKDDKRRQEFKEWKRRQQKGGKHVRFEMVMKDGPITLSDEPKQVDLEEKSSSSGEEEENRLPINREGEIERRVGPHSPGVRGFLVPERRSMAVVTDEESNEENEPKEEPLVPHPLEESKSAEMIIPEIIEEKNLVENVKIDNLTPNEPVEKFTLAGKTLKLPNVSKEDSLHFRIESLRLYLENELGLDDFIRAYQLIKAIQDAEEDKEEALSNQLTGLLPGKKMNLCSLILQLVYCENQLFE